MEKTMYGVSRARRKEEEISIFKDEDFVYLNYDEAQVVYCKLGDLLTGTDVKTQQHDIVQLKPTFDADYNHVGWVVMLGGERLHECQSQIEAWRFAVRKSHEQEKAQIHSHWENAHIFYERIKHDGKDSYRSVSRSGQPSTHSPS